MIIVNESLYEPSLIMKLKHPMMGNDMNNRLTFMRGLLSLADERERVYLVHREMRKMVHDILTLDIEEKK